MKKIVIILGIILVGVVFFIINISTNEKTKQNPNKLQIVTSFYPMYFFTSQITGDKADVYNVTPASAEPHDYEPTTQDITQIENSNLLVLQGGNLEAWGSKIKEALSNSSARIVTAGDRLFTKQDPHVWLDPVLAKQEAHNITNALISIDRKNATYFQDNEKVLDAKLDALNQEYKQGLSSCQKKDIITSHAAFGYLAARYGLTQVSISGISPDQEPSVKELAQLSDFVKKNSIKYIFFESLVSPKLAQTIATETGAQTLVLDPIEGIPDDQLKQGTNYFTIMKQNLTNLQIALGCNK